ncbi:hypothetical protein ACLBWT_18765 [Paenibacillus sp. D51F]
MSKKLNGNGRWEGSRMMLPEHRELFLERKRKQVEQIRGGSAPQITPAQSPTREELGWIREYTLLPMLLTLMERNCQELERTQLSMRTIYIKVTHKMMDLVSQDLFEVKRSLKNSNIKIYPDEQVDTQGAHYRFICRGYEDRFVLMRDIVRSDMSVRLTNYMKKALQI